MYILTAWLKFAATRKSSKNSKRALRNLLKNGDYNTVGDTVSVRECAVLLEAVDTLL